MPKAPWFLIAAGCLLLSAAAAAAPAEAPVSDATAECLECHAVQHPGIVADWRQSRHAKLSPRQAMAQPPLARRISAESVPAALAETAVGCAECHTARPEAHADTFEHNGHQVHVVVSPMDCAGCHPVEQGQFERNLMSRAYGNLAHNALYNRQEAAILGAVPAPGGPFPHRVAPARAEGCYYCHGTRLAVTGRQVRDTELAGELEFPVIDGWPNQGVGRVNLDGSRGACTACHTRHRFSAAMARKPYTCRECHVGPDVPAYKVYAASKHGNLFAAHQSEWDFEAMPWRVGEDFTAPTCAACHISLVVGAEGEVVAPRTHQMNDRLPWRIFGLIYAHPHPRQADTTVIRNRDGQPLPTDFAGGTAAGFLIDEPQMAERRQAMQALCLRCHDRSWVAGHWGRFENTIRETNAKTLAATGVMEEIWRRKLAERANPFDEAVETLWVDTWLFHANTTRFASAMGGGGDYGVYAGGRYQLRQRSAELADWLRQREALGKPSGFEGP